MDVGIFAKRTGKKNLGKPLLMQRVKITAKDNTFTLYVKEPHSEVGIDAYNYLVDRIPDDNLKKLN